MRKLVDLFCHVDNFVTLFYLSGKNFNSKVVSESVIVKGACPKEK
nr:hypothetical protein [Vibrio diazotrophicus]